MPLCYREIVKNVTISLPDEVYRRVRIKAAERETSLSGFIAGLLEEAARTDDLEAAERARKDRIALMVQEIHASQAARGKYFNASRRMTREEVHDRKTLR
jgi:macrodomain Ter protein organizer (MatP/YcbG family)